MLTLQKTNCNSVIDVATKDKPVEELLQKEWLLTNSRGGYASSTVIGCNTRKYHSLLVGTLNPPANRIMSLANCMEMVISQGKVFNLSTFEFNEKFSPIGCGHVKRFRKDIGVHFDYQFGDIELTKSVYLLRDSDTVVLEYDFTGIAQPVELVLRPFVGLRDFHTLQKSYAHLNFSCIDDGLLIRHDTPASCELFLKCQDAAFETDKQWWFNFLYRNDKQRGQEYVEDLWTPGFFKCRVDAPKKITFWANLSSKYDTGSLRTDIEEVCENLNKHQHTIITSAKAKDENLKILSIAADQFVTKRIAGDKQRTTILAGFPWFADWGRDAFIALPGLLLSTGRFEEAKSVLTTFASAADKGMIPNRFDDRSDTAHFNSIDASFWFVNAAFQYLDATSDTQTFTDSLLPTIRWIIDSYYNGTRFDIHADADCLLTGGDEDTQLTWMDAKYDGVCFTPRYGKSVEINALWYNSLCSLAQFFTDRDIEAAKHYHLLADRVEAAFCKLFCNESTGYLNDCILPDGTVDTAIRPNQIFAVSLPFSPLTFDWQKSVTDAVQQHLLTPFGLRTLAPDHHSYKGQYEGPQAERDAAYHQGTAWPYLMGHFIESYLKVNNFSKESKANAAGFIEPLMNHLTEDGCMGTISEIFDGSEPYKPKGCFAQAWSVAELIRAFHLIND